MNTAKLAKSILAGAIVSASGLATALADNGITEGEIATIAAAGLATIGSWYGISREGKPVDGG